MEKLFLVGEGLQIYYLDKNNSSLLVEEENNRIHLGSHVFRYPKSKGHRAGNSINPWTKSSSGLSSQSIFLKYSPCIVDFPIHIFEKMRVLSSSFSVV